MNIFHKLFNKLGRYRLIHDRRTGADYMHRYYLFLRDRCWFPFNLTLHKIVRSDDPVFHDHPWPYMTIILKGGYYEHTPLYIGKYIRGEKIRWRGPGSIIIRGSKALHWLEMDPDVGSATTLFFMGPQVRDWGFVIKTKDTPKGNTEWIKHDECLDNWDQLVK
jgi:hypothetical protein